MTRIDLRDLLVKRLAATAGGPAQRWRRAIGEVRVYPLATHPHCNWSVMASGTAWEIETVEQLLDAVRIAHPHVAAG
jgi:hypothetical protein